MTLNYVTLVLDLYDGQGNPVISGVASLTPSVQLTDTTDNMLVTQAPVPGVFHSGGFPMVKLLATDDGALAPAGWGWTISFSGVAGNPAPFSFFLPFTGGSTQYLSSIAPTSSVVTMAAYLPLKYTPGASSGYVWTSDASGNGSWQVASGGGGGGAVTSVFTRTGGVVATSGDYAVGQVTGAAPLASPTFTGTPAAPTATALTNTTQVATTAYADAAVGVETTRAETAEALKAPLASPTLTGTPAAPTKSPGTNSTAIATTAYADAAVAVAEGLALALTGGTMSGAIAMGSHKVTGLTNGSSAQDAAAFGQIPAALPPNGSAGGVLSGTYPNPGYATTPLPQSGGTMTGWLAPAVVTLSFVGSGTTLINAASGNVFILTLTASTTTLGAPSNPVDGQAIRLRVIQDGTGSRTMAFNSVYDFGAAGAPTLSTGINKVDILGFEYVSSISKWAYLGSGLGF